MAGAGHFRRAELEKGDARGIGGGGAVQLFRPADPREAGSLARGQGQRLNRKWKKPRMSEFVFEPPPAPSVAVAGTAARFPVRRIFCVGRNYAAHAREMGRDPDREPPFFFLKPSYSV